MNKTISLVADIGGTNIRLALTDISNNITNIETYQCAQFTSLFEVISQYLTEKNIAGSSVNACLAIAGPVDNDIISMTNLPWQICQKQLKDQLKLKSLHFINDFSAIAMAIPFLNNEQKLQIGGIGEPTKGKAISVCGPGTGLGVATLIAVNNKWHCLSGEGGHSDFAPVDELEMKILHHLQEIKNRVSYEQLLSGYGLEQIYRALISINQIDANVVDERLSAENISSRAVANSCQICYQALSIFCRVLGSFAGNLALTMNSLGGVYIAGGIVPKFIEFIQQSDFRLRFETKGRLSTLTRQAPTYIIKEKQPGLLGASVYLNQI